MLQIDKREILNTFNGVFSGRNKTNRAEANIND